MLVGNPLFVSLITLLVNERLGFRFVMYPK